MLRSLFSGITGLRAHQNLMDVVSNNISNVNTTGFKASSVVFEDTLSQTLRNAGAPTASAGGINPAQIGLGVQLAAVNTNFSQGSAQNTGKSTDLMIQGDGFFMVKNGGETTYTRSGAFTFDTSGRLVTPEGNIVQGWVGTNGVVNVDGPPVDIKVPAGTLVPPTPSTKVTIGGNITAAPMPTAPATPSVMTLSATVYDKTGVAHSLTITVTQSSDSPPTYDVSAGEDPAALSSLGSVVFTTAGAYDSDSLTPYALPDGTSIAFDAKGITQYGGEKSLNVTATDGSAAGSLQQFQIGTDGSVLGIFSNGQKMVMAKIALANFNNPAGLEKIGNTAFRATTNSGIPQVGAPDSGGRGTLLGGTLEMSNVDLAQEFTNLIIAQRGFQANSRVITTSDEMLQQLVDIKR